jgi:hypothetical protein
MLKAGKSRADAGELLAQHPFLRDGDKLDIEAHRCRSEHEQQIRAVTGEWEREKD